ncbi:hypothetical protein NM688_g4329 [Phlebia brevispora]|uniref:Uncharacterized protein n=1 Tax=Phlebia brevispora TaxID=194682 RepID=A0ACC1T3D0_9APHY|nr:hypothetical protein NM688_g4329 [Phlebia brevispora]
MELACVSSYMRVFGFDPNGDRAYSDVHSQGILTMTDPSSGIDGHGSRVAGGGQRASISREEDERDAKRVAYPG